ncbi:MAG: hypothetical protein AAGI91_08245 [Bacteroidota bacterium]
MLFPDLPPDARVWVFTADRSLSPDEQDRLLGAMRQFTAQWGSHGRPVPGEATVLHDRFLVVAAHLQGGVSGCGIDSMTHAAEAAGQALGIDWIGGLQVVYRDASGAVQALPRAAFRDQVRAGAVTADTLVFVTTVDTVENLRSGGLERPAHAAWHARVFRLAHPV